MGRIKIHEIKKASFDLLDSYPGRFTEDFESNKKALSELSIAPSKRVKNKIAGYITRSYKIRSRKA